MPERGRRPRKTGLDVLGVSGPGGVPTLMLLEEQVKIPEG